MHADRPRVARVRLVQLVVEGRWIWMFSGPRSIPANHTRESYPESYPRIIPPNHTSSQTFPSGHGLNGNNHIHISHRYTHPMCLLIVYHRQHSLIAFLVVSAKVATLDGDDGVGNDLCHADPKPSQPARLPYQLVSGWIFHENTEDLTHTQNNRTCIWVRSSAEIAILRLLEPLHTMCILLGWPLDDNPNPGLRWLQTLRDSLPHGFPEHPSGVHIAPFWGDFPNGQRPLGQTFVGSPVLPLVCERSVLGRFRVKSEGSEFFGCF